MPDSFLKSKGDYRNLLAFKKAECIYDATYIFTKQYLGRKDRTVDQMLQAARSGKQNIAEGSAAAPTSKETEIKLFNVARASLQELLLDYEDYLRTRQLELWTIGNPRLERLRQITTANNEVEFFSRCIFPKCNNEMLANLAVTMIHQADYLLGKLIDKAKLMFLQEGGAREEMTRARIEYRKKNNRKL